MAKNSVLGICGSLRVNSWNKKLLLLALKKLESQGYATEYLDLKALELPVFDEDLEEKIGSHPGAVKLAEKISSCGGLVIGCPEYNGGMTGALKNAIDWATRTGPNPFAGKPILLVGTSTGWWGGVRSSMMARQTLVQLQALVAPAQVNIPLAEQNISEAGELKNPDHVKMMKSAVGGFVKILGKT